MSYKKLILAASLFVLSLGGVLAVGTTPAFAASRCYGQKDGTGNIYAMAKCDYATLQGSGFNMSGLPNPLEDTCYAWTNDVTAAGVTVDCSDPKYVAASAAAAATPDPEINPDAVKDAVSETAANADAKTKASFTSRNSSVNCDGSTPDKLQKCVSDNPLIQQMTQIIQFLTIGVSVVITIIVIIGGFQYMTARNNPQAVTGAKKKIAAALIAFVAYMLLWAFMQYLIPGGVI